MPLRSQWPAPVGRVDPARRGAIVGRYCLECSSVYPPSRLRHAGPPLFGRDHVGATCGQEGQRFGDQAQWWEPAVEILSGPEEARAEAPE